jgi:hypothetical protein
VALVEGSAVGVPESGVAVLAAVTTGEGETEALEIGVVVGET